MARLLANGVWLDQESTGGGEPVVFIHGVLIASVFEPVVAQPALAAYRCITYARRGYAGSDHPPGATTVEQQASDCRALIAALGVEAAHIVGHSYGGAIALQVALDAPDIVHSLSLLEPALIVGDSAEGYRSSLAATIQRAHEAGLETAADEFLEMRSPGYRERLDNLVPDALEQVVRDARTTMDYELPGLPDWSFPVAHAARISAPTLILLGERSKGLSPRFAETYHFLLEHLPNVEGAVVLGATHLMQTDEPAAVAEAVASFLRKHAISSE